MTWLVRNRLLFSFIILFLLSGSTYFLIQIARGYRYDPKAGELKAHGLLALKSRPDGAKIYVNGVLNNATDTTLALTPGKYQIDIEKPNYNHWSKLLTIKKELVTQADIFLFPLIPTLQPITFDGVLQPIVSPDRTMLSFISSSATNATELWVFSLGGGLLDFNRSPRLVFDNLQSLTSNNKYRLNWSPDSKWLIVSTANDRKTYLINPVQPNLLADVITRSVNYLHYSQQWERSTIIQKNIDYKKLPKEIIDTLNTKADNVSFSPDGLKILYMATDSASLASNIITPPVVFSTQIEDRQLQAKKYYVYDIKEDKNFVIPCQPTGTLPHWLPSSNHLFWVESFEDKPSIWVSEYDGLNKSLIFKDNFDSSSVFTEINMGKILILSNLGGETDNKYNLYSLDLIH